MNYHIHLQHTVKADSQGKFLYDKGTASKMPV